jgi:hypothetical protein
MRKRGRASLRLSVLPARWYQALVPGDDRIFTAKSPPTCSDLGGRLRLSVDAGKQILAGSSHYQQVKKRLEGIVNFRQILLVRNL